MRRTAALLLAALALGGGGVAAGAEPPPVREIPTAAPEEAGLSPTKLDLLAPAVDRLVEQGNIPGAITVVARRGHVVHARAAGSLQLHSIVRIASMTKPITAAALLILHDEGRFRLDDPVSKYLPELGGLRVHPSGGNGAGGPFRPRRAMTIRDLLRHTSGIAHYAGPGPVERMYSDAAAKLQSGSLEDLVQWMGTVPLLHEPGARWYYGLSYEVVARLVEVLSGEPLDVFLQERIFDVLDMRDTGFLVPEGKRLRLAALFAPDGHGGFRVVDEPAASSYLRRPELLSGGGGLVSTARDYLRFSQMLLDGGELHGRRLLRKSTVKLMTSDRLPRSWPPGAVPLSEGMRFGFGVAVVVGPPGRRGEYAWGGSVGTNFWVSPKDELVGLTLTQCTAKNDLRAVVHDLVADAVVE